LNKLDLKKTKLPPSAVEEYNTCRDKVLNFIREFSLTLDDFYYTKRLYKQFHNYLLSHNTHAKRSSLPIMDSPTLNDLKNLYLGSHSSKIEVLDLF
jgi:hypothetical protein